MSNLARCLVLLVVSQGWMEMVAKGVEAGFITDGGFENATPNTYNVGSIGDGWNVAEGQIVIETSAGNTFGEVAHSGNQLAYLDLGYDANGLAQSFATTLGQAYTVGFYIADDQIGDSLMVTFGSQILFNGLVPQTGVTSPADYQFYSYTAVATSANTTLSFIGQFNQTNPYGLGTILDDVSVNIVPESSSFTLCGIAGIIVWRAASLCRRSKNMNNAFALH